MSVVEKILASSAALEAQVRDEMAKKAEYKIQVFCHSKRSIHRNLVFSMSAWLSGKREHGGGDSSLQLCSRRKSAADVRPLDAVTFTKDKPRGCMGFIPPHLSEGDVVVCPHCMATHKKSDIGDTVLYSVPVADAADIVAQWWQRAGGNADVVLVYAPFDIRAVAADKEGRGLRRARESRETSVYTLANILADTANGALLAERFKAFLLW